MKEIEDDSDGKVIHTGPAASGLTVMVVEFRSQTLRNLQNMNTWQLVRPRIDQKDACSVV